MSRMLINTYYGMYGSERACGDKTCCCCCCKTELSNLVTTKTPHIGLCNLGMSYLELHDHHHCTMCSCNGCNLTKQRYSMLFKVSITNARLPSNA